MALTLLLATVVQPVQAAPAQAASAPNAPLGGCPTVVSNANDAGAGSLRAAVGCAVAGDTVTFSGPAPDSVIFLTTGEIAITKSLEIDGSNISGLRIDGSNLSRIFNLTAAGPVTLTALILQHGSTAGNGGAVLADAGSPLVIQKSAVLSSTTTGGWGGGVYAGSLRVANGQIQGNTCIAAGCPGGGLYSETFLTLSGTEVISNSSQSYGGGTYAYNTVLTNGRFLGNRCVEDGCWGGGLLSHFLTLTGTEFISNTSRFYGGGALAYDGATLTNGRFERNVCTQAACGGGGLFSYALTVSGTEFISNTSQGSGGGVWAPGTAILTNGRFHGNAANAGGGVWSGTTLALTGTEFISNTSVLSGGGLFATGPVTLTSAYFERNACTSPACTGGGLSATNTAVLTGTEFVGNTSQGNGGGAATTITATLTNGRFERNTCAQAGCLGGGLYSTSTVALTGVEFISNTSRGNGGGAVTAAALTLLNGRWQGNTCMQAGCLGGGLFATSTVELIGTEFISNTSLGGGGGLAVLDVARLSASYFQGNVCSEILCLGGGLYVPNNAAVDSSTFNGNQVAGWGGGLSTTGLLTLTNSTLSGNAASAGGGLYANGTGRIWLLNVTMSGNQAPVGGGVWAGVLVSLGVTNTLVANNGAANCGGQIDFGSNNLEWPGTACATAGPGAGFASADPLLAPLALNAPGATFTYALRLNSPARDAGHPATCAGPLVNNRDQRGVVRPIDGDNITGAVCDIGAYEAAAPWLLFIPIVTR